MKIFPDIERVIATLYDLMPSSVLLDADHRPKVQVRFGSQAQLAHCDTLIHDYNHELNGFLRSRSYAGVFAVLGTGGMLWGSRTGGVAGGGGVLGGGLCLWVSYKCILRMTEFKDQLLSIRKKFMDECTEPWTEAAELPVRAPVNRPAPVQSPQHVARSWALPESVRESLRRPIAIPEIPELTPTEGVIDRHGTAIAYGAGAAVCAGAAIAIVAFNWTVVVATLDPAIPGLVAASASLGHRSAQLFAR